MMDNDNSNQHLSFKEASIELEQLVRSLESGELELEDSLVAYEKGVSLLRYLKSKLEHAEQQVEELQSQSSELELTDTRAAVAQASELGSSRGK